jgi:hypothetical protein
MNDFQHFFLVGAQRSATTYLYHVLNEHPEIEMAVPVKPEPKFFLAEDSVTLGATYYESAYFRGKTGAWLRGEKSTSYIEHELAAQHIAAVFPQARILFSLRNPIDRAVSNYWFSVNNGVETASLEEAFLHEDERREAYDKARFSVSPFAYLKRGLYIDYLTMYGHYFSRAPITVLLAEQVTSSPERTLSELYAALGVGSDFVPPSAHRLINDSQRPDDQPLSPTLRHYLTDYFAEANARLADYLGVDLAQFGW